jgi:dihydroorotate dehydrogenase electron transfer subunit
MIATALARVVERTSPMAGGVELTCETPLAASVQPGQFLQVAVEGAGTLLRRPYSVAWVDPHSARLGLVFSVVGAGSAWLASREPDDELDLLGPLGRGFAFEAPRPGVCVAGGLGIAVFIGLAQALVGRGRSTTILYGARSAGQLMPPGRFWGAQVTVATDDGSAGHHGPVTELLRPALVQDADIFACGPTPMLVTLARWAMDNEFPLHRIQVAHETPMGCGMGTCLGCALPRAEGGYLLTCQDGPCIAADRVNWSEMVNTFHG